MMNQAIPLVLSTALLSGCETMTPDDFAQQRPELDIYQYFTGETLAWGLFEDRFGRVRRQFQVDITGHMENGELVLEEDFLYDDGERDRRVWRIRRDGPQGYIGVAADVVGQAQGKSSGNALNWRYTMDMKVDNDTWRVNFDDWMFLQPNGVLLNRARVTKFGFEIGSVSLFFKKQKPQRDYAKEISR